MPTAIGLVWAAGVLAIAGVALDLFALFAVVTFVGIGVDYGVHIVHRYRERGDATQAIAELAPVDPGCRGNHAAWLWNAHHVELSAASIDRPGLGA